MGDNGTLSFVWRKSSGYYPDIPIVGQIDDLIIMASGTLNLAQRYMERADSSLTSIVKVTKWIVIALGAIVILILALFAVAIVNLFK